MEPPPEALEAFRLARDRRRGQQQLTANVVAILRRIWRLIDPADIQGSWQRLSEALLAATTIAQAQAVGTAQEYVAALLAAQGVTPRPSGFLVAERLVGIAADGRSLSSLLTVPAGEVIRLIDGGMQPIQALRAGRRRLERIVITEIADAGRVATGVAQVADLAAHGYLRMVTAPSCARCIILSGKFFQANAGFQRHPLCDCVHVPAAQDIEPGDPEELFNAMSEAEQDRVFTRAGAQAIRDGADINQVVNARRGMRSAGVFGRRALTTLEGTTRRGFAGKRLGGEGGFRKVPGQRLRRAIPVRLMPEQIYADARRLGYNREQTVRLLKLHGYIT